MKLTFLGTGCMMPTKERGLSTVFLEYRNYGILFDCAEGTQRQMRLAGIPLTKVTHICLSHWHGDHVLGLPGFLSTLGSMKENAPITVYGPKGTKEHVRAMFDFVRFEVRVDLKVEDVGQGTFFENEDFSLSSGIMKHKVPCVGFAFKEADRRRIDVVRAKQLGIPQGPLLGKIQQGKSISFKGKTVTPEEVSYIVPGKKIVYVTDTVITKQAEELSEDADLLICESSFAPDMGEKAAEYGHITSRDAAELGAKANVKQLILTHISGRYADTRELEKAAKEVFPKARVAHDFLEVEM